MATTAPQIPSTANPALLAADYMERLEELAQRHGWSVDDTMRRALDITEIVLNAKEESGSKVYVYKGGKRYALEVQD